MLHTVFFSESLLAVCSVTLVLLHNMVRIQQMSLPFLPSPGRAPHSCSEKWPTRAQKPSSKLMVWVTDDLFLIPVTYLKSTLMSGHRGRREKAQSWRPCWSWERRDRRQCTELEPGSQDSAVQGRKAITEVYVKFGNASGYEMCIVESLIG